jgi:hypothetical protein
MNRQILAAAAVRRVSFRLAVGVALLALPAQVLVAVTCGVIKHNPPTEAGKAFLAADFAKAETLYRADLAKNAGDVDATVGLVETLLAEQKTPEAADAVKTALAAAPASAPFLTLRGEVELRQGQPWVVEQTVLASYKLDPCNPRTRLLFARFAQVNSRYATARQQILLAHQFDPEDPEIRLEWIKTLPADQRIKELDAYLSAPSGNDAATLHQLHSDLDRWKKEAGEAPHACHIASTAAPADIPFINLAGLAGHTRGYGLEAGINNASVRLQFGAGEGGLTIYRPVADRAGLKRLSQPEAGGAGKPTYTALADTIKVGNLEFKDCVVKVIDSGSPFDDGEGTIGMDVFSDYMVTLDYPMHKVQLGALPLRPGETAADAPILRTVSADNSAVPHDRYIAPEMKDYTQVYRVGGNLILPAALNASNVKLFLLDLGADATDISPSVAMDVSKVHEKDMEGPAGASHKILIADEITFNFAHMSQKVNGVVAADTGMRSKAAGMEIAGSIGANTFSLLIMRIDYRDGLVKFEYIPNRGYNHQ